MDKLKIAVIGLKGLPAFGGAATVGENIIEELKDKYDFYVYATASHAQETPLTSGYRQIVFKKFFVKKLNILYYYFCSVLHCLFSSKYDLVHLHHIDGAFFLPLLRLRYKVICTSHAQPQINEKWPKLVKWFFRLNERIALSMSSKFTAVSLPLKEVLTKKTSRTIHYIPNGINLQQEILEGRPVADPYMLFSAGRILPLKGLHVLLEALKLGKINKKLLIIGNLEQIPSYRDEILDQSKGLNVEFVPLIKEKKKLLQYVKNAELFIFPSYTEAMSIMLLEVAFARTPIVCSDIPANTAIFDDSETLFFKTNSSSDLLEKINFAFENYSIMKQKTDAAFIKLQSDYNWSSIAKQYAQLYESLA